MAATPGQCRGVADDVVEPSATDELQRVNGLRVLHDPLSSSNHTNTSCVLPTPYRPSFLVKKKEEEEILFFSFLVATSFTASKALPP